MTALQASILNLSHDGRGVARENGKAVFIEGALPGEEVSYRLLKSHKRYDEGEMVSLLQPSHVRVSPPCPYVESCGGCTLQHVTHSAQIEYKEALFWETLKRIGGVEPRVRLPALIGPAYGYRHRARLHVRVIKNKVLLGFKAKGTEAVVAIGQCLVLEPALSSYIAPLQQLLQTFSKPAVVHEISIAIGQGGFIGVLFHLKEPLMAKDSVLLVEFSEAHALNMYVEYHSKRRPLSEIHPGPLYYPFKTQNPKLMFSLGDFTQINPRQNEAMLAASVEMMNLSSQDVVGDLFCGLGNFALWMAPYVQQVVGAEVSSDMVRAARDNALENNRSNVTFEKIDFDAPEAIQHFLRQYSCNKLVIDPPRKGAQALVDALSSADLDGVLYISCHPGTLARDAKVLTQEHGFTLQSSRVIDMFPQTAHIEAMAWFTR
ncbi:MAG: methyltransferase domain-containing protein [Legionellaceae bacterium]|nr:methyltransferase domain-containing protein [Legionellaceae bacterium]